MSLFNVVASKLGRAKLRLRQRATSRLHGKADRLRGTSSAQRWLDDNVQALDRNCLVVGQGGHGVHTFLDMVAQRQCLRGGLLMVSQGDSGEMVCRGGDRHVGALVPCGYNPILDGEAREVAARVVEVAPSTRDNAGADFFKGMALARVAVLVDALRQLDCTCVADDLVPLLVDTSAIPALRARLSAEHLVTEWIDVVADEDAVTRARMLGPVGRRLEGLVASRAGACLNIRAPMVRMRDVIENQSVLRIELPTLGRAGASEVLARMIVRDYADSVSSASLPHPPWPGLAIFVEGAACAAADYSRILGQGRAAGQSVVLASHAVEPFGDAADTVLANVATKILFRQGTMESAERLSSMDGGVSAQDLMEMDPGEAIVIRDGRRAERIRL